MTHTVDYYVAPQSPWTYLGHARFVAMAQAAGATVRLFPADLGKVFAATGGLPLGQRSPQRQAYRLMELARWSDHLGLPMNVKPKFFPVAGDDAARLFIAVDRADGIAAALNLVGRTLAAVWAQERDIASADTRAALLAEAGLPARRIDDAAAPEVQAAYVQNSQQAIDANVFGAPAYVIDGDVFWGQDRLDFVERKLQRGS